MPKLNFVLAWHQSTGSMAWIQF